MRPHERRLIRRVMLLATLLVAAMLAATIWTVLQSGSRGLSSGPGDTGSSTDTSSSGAAAP